MNRAQLKESARQQIRGNIWMYLLCIIIYAAIISICSFIPLVGWIATIILTPTLSLGITLIALGMTHGIKPDVSTLFDGFKNFGPAVVFYLLQGIFTFLWSLLLFIPGIIKAISYSMGFYIMAEHPEMSGLEALNESKRIMRGHKWDFFVLELSFILWSLLVSCTCGIAAIYVVPYMSTTIANFYNSIKDGPGPGTSSGSTSDYTSYTSDTTYSSRPKGAAEDGTYYN